MFVQKIRPRCACPIRLSKHTISHTPYSKLVLVAVPLDYTPALFSPDFTPDQFLTLSTTSSPTIEQPPTPFPILPTLTSPVYLGDQNLSLPRSPKTRKLATRKPEGIPSHAVPVDRDAAATMFAAPVLWVGQFS